MSTLIAEALGGFEDSHGAVVPGIQPSTTFKRDTNYELLGDHIYRRNSSPTVDSAEKALAIIDGGVDSMVFGSGMAAVAAFVGALAPGSHIVAPRVMYHGAQDWLKRLEARGELRLTLFDAVSLAGLERACASGVDLAWIETPTNPTWDVIDIRGAAAAVHEAGGMLAVDSTVAPAVTTRPLTLGADYVFHSGTKYLNGHSDVTAGVLSTQSESDHWDEVGRVRVAHGSIISPFDAWLLMRGMRTLAVRYRRASGSALALAEALVGQPGLERVLYPGLASHPGHQVAVRQMTGGFGGMMSVLVEGGSARSQAVATRTKLFQTATSLGGTESLIEHRASVEGPHSVVPENLIRISVGLEDPDDLIEDLIRALSSSQED